MSSLEYKGKRVVIWPSYLDSSLSRSGGRRLPLKDSVRNPRVDEIIAAARILGLNPVVERKGYPRRWWSDKARVVVNKVRSKRETLRLIAKTIRELREKAKS